MIDTAEYRRWYGLDKPWTGGSDIVWHLGQALHEIDRLRLRIAAAKALFPSHADWCCSKGCVYPEHNHCAGIGCTCEVGPFLHALDEDA